MVAWLVETKGYSRWQITALLGVSLWLLGLGTVFSFNYWAEATLFGNTVFDSLDFLTANIMLPLGGLLIAIFVGWSMKKSAVAEEVGGLRHPIYRYWYFILSYVSPVLIGIVFIANLF